MADEAFSGSAMAEREMQALESPSRNMAGGAISDQELEAFLASLSPEDREAILAMSNERTTGPSTVVPMSPVNPGAFAGVQPNMDPAMRAMSAERTTGPAMDQNSMMEYIQRKADDIKSRMGGRQPEGSVDDYLKATTGAAMSPEESFTKRMLGAESGAAMTPEEMQMMRGTK